MVDSSEEIADPLEQYRQSLEEHVMRQAHAKAEARARFESRSLDLIPKLTLTALTANKTWAADADAAEKAAAEKAAKKAAEAAAQFDRDVDLLPPPRIELDDDDLPSPSDLPFSTDRDLDDRLLPVLPKERDDLGSSERKIPAPLKKKRDEPTESPSRLGGDSTPPLPQSKSPSEKREWKSPPTPDFKDRSTEPSDDQNDDRATERKTASDSLRNNRSERRSQSVLDVPVDPRYPNATHWTGLIEDEQKRWPMPASHRPHIPVFHVACSACGGCVDRHGVGVRDKLGVSIGIGTREQPACQCWRCPHGAPFNLYGPGGYAGPARSSPLPEYRLRAGDQVQLTFLIKTIRSIGSYRLVVGDELLVESDADANLTRGTLDRGLEIQPDGTLTLRFIGQVHAAGQTIEQLRDLLNDRYEEFYPDPAIDVTPVRTGNVARQIREAISGSEGFNPQQALQTVTPEGTLRLPRLGAIPTQGLTLGELKREINLRYDSIGAGLEVEVMLEQQAPHYVYVLGEVARPGRFEMDAPTTVLGAMSLAGSFVPGANLRQVVVFRRGENWELLSTVLDLRGALLGKASRPVDEIWVQDGDVIILPPAPIRLFDRFVQQVFTEGIYGIVPFGGFSVALGDNN